MLSRIARLNLFQVIFRLHRGDLGEWDEIERDYWGRESKTM